MLKDKNEHEGCGQECTMCGLVIGCLEWITPDIDLFNGSVRGFVHMACYLSEEEMDLLQEQIDRETAQNTLNWTW